MILKLGDKLNPEDLRREVKMFLIDTKLDRWHGITFNDQEFRAQIKEGIADVYELGKEEKKKQKKEKTYKPKEPIKE